jgi:superfamily II DNA or RNA helicase
LKLLGIGNREKAFDRASVYRILFSLYGTEVLREKKLRRLLCLTLLRERLQDVAESLGLEPDRKPFDIALAVSNQLWVPGGKVVSLFASLFSIPDEFLPSREDEVTGHEIIPPFTPPPNLFKYQEELVKLLVPELQSRDGKACLLQLPTGAGKTRTVLEALTVFANRAYEESASSGILWLAHTEELCEQAIESFKRVWTRSGSYDLHLFRFWGDYRVHVNETRGGFIVGGFQKVALLASKDPIGFQKLLDGVSVFVIDEAHKALAPTIRHLVETAKKQGRVRIVGLTATPGRKANNRLENRQLSRLFDNKLLTAKSLGRDPIGRLQKMGILARISHIPISSQQNYYLTDAERDTSLEWGDLSSTVLRKLAKDEKRNDIILAAVRKQVEQKRQTIVFACSVEHAAQLAARFAAEGFLSAAIDCRMRKSLRRRCVLEFKRGNVSALFNYGVLSTGFDAPNIRCVVIARPTTSVVLYSQMVGRGLRGKRVGGNEQCILIDVVDNFENFGGVAAVYDYFREFWKPVKSV